MTTLTQNEKRSLVDMALRGETPALLNFFLSPEFDEQQLVEQDSWVQTVIEALKARSNSRTSLRVSYDSSLASWCTIHDLLSVARETGKEARVAQYLVGAKLALRFPNLKVENFSYSTADDQLGRPGDFYLGDTAFHVTVAPQAAVFEKCRLNLDQGYRVYLLVPDRALMGARQNAEAHMAGKIAVESIESFVGNNVEELSEFSKDKLRDGFKRLFEAYNQRVDAVENDKSLLLEIPPNLL